MKTEKLALDDRFGDEFKGQYVFQQISWGKRSRIIQRHTKYSPTGQVTSTDFVIIQAETIMASLKEQPKNNPLTLERLLSEREGIPVELGEVLSSITNQLNGLSKRGLRFLLERLSEEKRTQLFQSFGFVKSSG